MAKTKLSGMTEAKAKEISQSTNLDQYPHEMLVKADAWIKDYALAKLQLRLTEQGTSKDVRNYIALMVRSNYGSVETDAFLMTLDCYPIWLSK